MTIRKTDRELLDELESARNEMNRRDLVHDVISRFRDLLDRVDIVNDRAELHPVMEHVHQDRFDEGYATACQHCKEDLSDE